MSEDRDRERRDDVAELVRLGGRRAPVPPERLERARQAALATWREEVGRRSRRRLAWGAAALALAASLLALLGWRILSPTSSVAPVGESPSIALTVESVQGEAWVRPAAGGKAAPGTPLTVGDAVPSGSEVATGAGGRAALRLVSGPSVRLDHATRVAALEAMTLALHGGTIYVDSGREAATPGLAVHTPLAVVEEVGTQFEVRLAQGSLRVRLREGAVVLRHERSTHDVAAGTEFELFRDGLSRTRAIETHGPAWDWVASIAPPFDLEGRTARAFLDWVVRERGWRLEFTDETVARVTETTVLAGTIRGMTLEQSLDAVLPSSRLSYRIDDGVLRIAGAPPGPTAGE